MRREIKWENYLTNIENNATSNDVEYVEDKFSILFPKEYIQCATQHQGERPTPNRIPVGNGSSGLTTFLLFNDDPESEYHSYSLLHSHKVFEEEDYSSLLVPFGQAGGACLFCFDYRESKDNPTIVFIDWDSFGEGDEEAIIPIANNFTEFLNLLYEDED